MPVRHTCLFVLDRCLKFVICLFKNHDHILLQGPEHRESAGTHKYGSPMSHDHQLPASKEPPSGAPSQGQQDAAAEDPFSAILNELHTQMNDTINAMLRPHADKAAGVLGRLATLVDERVTVQDEECASMQNELDRLQNLVHNFQQKISEAVAGVPYRGASS